MERGGWQGITVYTSGWVTKYIAKLQIVRSVQDRTCLKHRALTKQFLKKTFLSNKIMRSSTNSHPLLLSWFHTLTTHGPSDESCGLFSVKFYSFRHFQWKYRCKTSISSRIKEINRMMEEIYMLPKNIQIIALIFTFILICSLL